MRSLSIQSATEQAKQDARKALGSEVILKSYDETGRGEIEYFPLHLVETLTKQDYVEGYNFLNNFHYVANNFTVIQGETIDNMEVIVTGEVPEDFKLPEIQLRPEYSRRNY